MTAQDTTNHEKKEEGIRFEQVQMNLQPGDIITSKKGMTFEAVMSGKQRVVTKAEYLGKGTFMELKAIGTVTLQQVNKK